MTGIRYSSPIALWLDLCIVVMTALFFRGDGRTAHVEEPAWTNFLLFNEPLPRRTAAQRVRNTPDGPPRQGTRRVIHRGSSTV
jgi:hypothetical protein